MARSCKCILDRMVFKGAMSEEDRDKILRNLKTQPVLDKIRAEIENDWQLKKFPSSPFSCGLRRAIEIIDKYKAESEEGAETEVKNYLKTIVGSKGGITQ